jgi:hypothetical protein
MQGRDDHLDPVVRHDLLSEEQVLLALAPDGRETALGRRCETVDELVQAGGCQPRRGGSGEEAMSSDSGRGHPSTTSPSERFRAVTSRLDPSPKVT